MPLNVVWDSGMYIQCDHVPLGKWDVRGMFMCYKCLTCRKIEVLKETLNFHTGRPIKRDPYGGVGGYLSCPNLQ